MPVIVEPPPPDVLQPTTLSDNSIKLDLKKLIFIVLPLMRRFTTGSPGSPAGRGGR